jgi:homocysteine S-methyltransferase
MMFQECIYLIRLKIRRQRTTLKMVRNSSLKDWFLRSGRTSEEKDQCDIPRILVLDGGVSTHLEEKLRQLHDATAERHNQDASSLFPYRELWSSGLLLSETGRKQVFEGHMDWLNAGVNMLSSATYQSHYVERLWPRASNTAEPQPPIITDDIMDQMWSDGIGLAKGAIQKFREETPVERPLYVVASSGCYGAALSNGAEYTGDYFDGTVSHEDAIKILQTFHLRKLHAAAAATLPDGIAIETVPSFLECQALSQLLQSKEANGLLCGNEENSGDVQIACYITFSCRNGSQLNDGTEITKALEELRTVPFDTLQAIGFNCCRVEYLPALLRVLVQEIVAFTPRRGIVVFPNSGETWNATHQHWETGTGLPMDHHAADIIMNHTVHAMDAAWDELSRSCPSASSDRRRKPSVLMGGCCRTTVETIGALRSLVDEYIRKNGES